MLGLKQVYVIKGLRLQTIYNWTEDVAWFNCHTHCFEQMIYFCFKYQKFYKSPLHIKFHPVTDLTVTIFASVIKQAGSTRKIHFLLLIAYTGSHRRFHVLKDGELCMNC